jgi:hypothetical protein
MTSPLSPYIQLTLDFYQNSISMTLSHMKKISTYLHIAEQRNLDLLRSQNNTKITINKNIDLRKIISSQLNETRSQTESNFSDWINEISVMRSENTDFFKKYAIAYSRIYGELISDRMKDVNISNTNESIVPAFLQQKMKGNHINSQENKR